MTLLRPLHRKNRLMDQVEALRAAKKQMLVTQRKDLERALSKVSTKLQSVQPEPIEYAEFKIPDATPAVDGLIPVRISTQMLSCAIKEINELGIVGTVEGEHHHHHHHEHDEEEERKRAAKREERREERQLEKARQAMIRRGQRDAKVLGRDQYDEEDEERESPKKAGGAKEVLHMLGGLHQQYRKMGDVSVQLRQRHRIDID